MADVSSPSFKTTTSLMRFKIYGAAFANRFLLSRAMPRAASPVPRRIGYTLIVRDWCRGELDLEPDMRLDFAHRTEIANWVNVGAILCSAFLLLSFFCLPVKWTHRHYLSICLVIGVMMMQVRTFVRLCGTTQVTNPHRLHSYYL